MPIAQPDFIPQPWANGDEDYRADVPNSAADAPAGRASWQMGYPPSTSLPLEAGGYAPARLDFNGGLYALSAHVFFQQSGSMYAWSNALDYNVGAAVLGSDGNEYRCVAANGVSSTVKNPVQDTAHAYWKPLTLFLTDIIYPVGSIYMTTSSANPGTIFGGTWQKIQNRFLLGSGPSRAAGETGGASTYTLTVSNMPSHNHAFSLTAASNGSHSHTLKAANVTAASAGSHSHSVTATAASAGAHTHTASTGSNGTHKHDRGTMEITGTFSGVGQHLHGTSATRNVVTGAFYYVNTVDNPSNGTEVDNDGQRDDIFGFKASNSWSGFTSETGAHTHTVTVNSNGAHTHTVSGTTATTGTHTHTVSGTTEANGAHTHTVTGSISNKGGGTAFSVMPPYFVVNVWQRTA